MTEPQETYAWAIFNPEGEMQMDTVARTRTLAWWALVGPDEDDEYDTEAQARFYRRGFRAWRIHVSPYERCGCGIVDDVGVTCAKHS